MRENVRPIVRFALFGTYTLIAVGLDLVRKGLREARVPAELKRRQAATPGRRRRAERSV